MLKRVPKGWVRTTVAEVCLPVEKIQPQDFPHDVFTYLDIGGIDGETNRINETKAIIGRDAPSRARQKVRKGDILFSNVRTYLRKIARIEEDYENAIASTGFTVVRPGRGISSEFLFYQMLTTDFLEPLHQLQAGTSYPAVRESDVLAQPILIAPTQEQRRLVRKVKSLLGSLDKGVHSTRRAKEGLLDYRTSVFEQAVTGELTKPWRERKAKRSAQTGETLLQTLAVSRRASWEELEMDRFRLADTIPKNDQWKTRYRAAKSATTTSRDILPKTWAWASIDQVSTRVTVGYVGPMKTQYAKSGIPFLRSQNVRPNRFDAQGLLFITPEFHRKLNKSRIVSGDVVIVRSGAVGTTCVIPKTIAEANCADLVVVQRPLIQADFISYYMNSVARHDVDAAKVGIALTHFNTTSVASQGIPVPPAAEQHEIVHQVQTRLLAANRLDNTLTKQLETAERTRNAILRKAFQGRLVEQNSTDISAEALLKRISAERVRVKAEHAINRSRRVIKNRGEEMKQPIPSHQQLAIAWRSIGKRPDARRLFSEAGYSPEQVIDFYEAIRANSEIREAFHTLARTTKAQRPQLRSKEEQVPTTGQFRLVELWLEDFKNLKDYTVFFNPAEGVDVMLGWNGTGKSNLFEALVIIFRDLHNWWEKNRWPDEPLQGFKLSYEIGDKFVEILWTPKIMKRPQIRSGSLDRTQHSAAPLESVKREQLSLPRFIFGYYSGPTNRLAEHFLPMKQAHYDRLRKARADDTETLAELLRQRRFFCAETHHAKYVLLAFSYKEDEKIDLFLKDRLRILGFESALFIIRKPRWAKRGTKAETFWGATGIMRRVMEKLRRHAIAPLVLRQKVSYGYRATVEDHYYFFLPDLAALHSFAAEYENARTFFLALESTDFSELIYDVKIQVRVKASAGEDVSITFHQLSEGEQQLLMVLGLMRFTKSHQSLILLDEPDTHLNPHWSIDYLKDLAYVMSDNASESTEQQTSQILMASHDPLVIASLLKEQIHLLKRDPKTGGCKWYPASIDPRGLGFTGILTSDMFGFRSDLDPETLADLDNRVRLVAKDEPLTVSEKQELEQIDLRLDKVGFLKAFSDPYYSAFVRAWGRRHSQLMEGQQFLTADEKKEIDRIADEVLQEAAAELEEASPQ